jgi:hypothetical protein
MTVADQGSQFEKDFGYLIPFLDKVHSAAAGMADSAAKRELVQLVAGEKERWTRIRDLLSSQPRSNPSSENETKREEPGTEKPERFERAFQYTVGSLRQR